MKESTHLFRQFTFTIGLDDLAILFRVNPVFPVSHLFPFAHYNVITGFRRKFFDGSEGNCIRKFHIGSFYRHAIRYLVIRKYRKKSSYFPACVKAEWNKNCANSIRSRLRNEMEDSNSNEAKQANVAVSSLNYFAVKYYLPKMTLMR